MSFITVKSRFLTNQTALDVGITDLMVMETLDGPMLYSASGAMGGVAAFDFSGTGTPGLADYALFDAGWSDGVLRSMSLVSTDTGAKLVVAGDAEDQLTAYSLSQSGMIGGVSTLDGLSGGADIINDVDQWTSETVFIGNTGTATIQAYALSPGGALTHSHGVGDTATTYAADAFALKSIGMGQADYVISASQTERGVTAFRMDTGGLVATDSIGVEEGLGIMVPTAMEVAQIDGRTFVLLASAPGDGQGQSGAISVLELSGTGSLRATDHLIDTLSTRFGNLQSLDVVDANGRVFVVAGGGDDGVTLFVLMPNGRLQLLDVIADGHDTGLQNVSALAVHADQDAMQIFAASESEAGITELEVDLSQMGHAVIARRGIQRTAGTALDDIVLGDEDNNLLEGLAGRDLIEDGAGIDTLRGGDGADTFILRSDGDHDVIEDFEAGIDRIDLSGWPMFYGAAQLDFTATTTGAILSFRDETLEIITRNGQSLSEADIAAALVDAPHRTPGIEGIVGNTPESYDITGSADADTISGEAGHDRIDGAGGDDSLSGGDGQDTLLGGEGHDTLLGGEGDDLLEGGTGADRLEGGEGQDTLSGQDGDDVLLGDAGADDLSGGAGADTLDGGAGADTLEGGEGDDHLLGGVDDDALFGGENADWIWGEDGADLLHGDAGDDWLDGGIGADTLEGGTGHDVLIGGADDDHLTGGAGVDDLRGGDGADSLWGGADDDRLDGDEGGDLLRGEGGADMVFGGAGNDTLWGGDGADLIRGGIGHDQLFGDDGNDMLWAGDGDDRIDGGAGHDVMRGGTGGDVFIFAPGHGVDRILDYDTGAFGDVLDFSALGQFADTEEILGPDGAATQVGDDVFVETGVTTGIWLSGINLDDLDADDFFV